LEGVLFEDVLIIERQIGRKPLGVRRVVLRCEHNFPVVIENECEIDGKPFPTLFWLVCPKLCREISRLEQLGWISRFEKIINEDPDFERATSTHTYKYEGSGTRLYVTKVRGRSCLDSAPVVYVT